MLQYFQTSDAGLRPSVPCELEFRCRNVGAPIVMVLNFPDEDTYLNWSSDEMDRICQVAIHRNISAIIVAAPEMPVEGYTRHWDRYGQMYFEPF